jgi:hypothetical protein
VPDARPATSTATTTTDTAAAAADEQSGNAQPAYSAHAMTGKELWQQYQHYTRDLTDHGRKLGFAGAAICWLFKDSNFTFPTVIYFALLAFVLFFIADILQALVGALCVRAFTEQAEAKLWDETKSIEGDIEKPHSVDRPAYRLFLAKCGFLIAGFLFVAVELLRRLIG